MKFGPLQTKIISTVTPTVVVGHQYYWGWSACQEKNKGGVTFCVSDSANSAVTGTAIKTWALIRGGTTFPYPAHLFPQPLNIVHGIRSKVIGTTGSKLVGTTVQIYFHG